MFSMAEIREPVRIHLPWPRSVYLRTSISSAAKQPAKLTGEAQKSIPCVWHALLIIARGSIAFSSAKLKRVYTTQWPIFKKSWQKLRIHILQILIMTSGVSWQWEFLSSWKTYAKNFKDFWTCARIYFMANKFFSKFSYVFLTTLYFR